MATGVCPKKYLTVPAIDPLVTVTVPPVAVEHGVPSLSCDFAHVSCVEVLEVAITLNRKFMSVPDPVSEPVVNPEMRSFPPVTLGVRVQPLVIVPVVEITGSAGLKTAESNLMSKSNALMLRPVVLLAVMGIVTTLPTGAETSLIPKVTVLAQEDC